jgi:hypothetical protein
MPTCSRTASSAIPTVRPATITNVVARVPRANRRRSAGPSWPSCAIAVDGASVPVASAMATGKENSTANSRSPSGPVTGAAPWASTEWVNPCSNTATALATNSSVITANVSRPPCPNQVSHAQHQQRQAQHDPGRGQCGQVGDQGAHPGRHRDGDGQHEVHDQRADGHEHPAGAERPRRALGGPAALPHWARPQTRTPHQPPRRTHSPPRQAGLPPAGPDAAADAISPAAAVERDNPGARHQCRWPHPPLPWRRTPKHKQRRHRTTVVPALPRHGNHRCRPDFPALQQTMLSTPGSDSAPPDRGRLRLR